MSIWVNEYMSNTPLNPLSRGDLPVVDEEGNIVERYEYDAYGRPTLWEGDYDNLMEGPSWYNNPYYFTGRRLDEIESGTWMIQYHRNRFYDYQTGRWLNQDPFGYLGGINLYQYCNNNPILLLDPYGYWSLRGIIRGIWDNRGTIGVVAVGVGGFIILASPMGPIIGVAAATIVKYGVVVLVTGEVLMLSDIENIWPTAEDVTDPLKEPVNEYNQELEELYRDLGIPNPDRWKDVGDEDRCAADGLDCFWS